MFYAIDYDTRKVESKNENDNLLQKYIVNNNLEMAVTLVSTREELVLKFSLIELGDLYHNLNGKGKLDINECWGLLEKSKVPKFTKKLGTKLLKAYPNERQPKRKSKKNEKKDSKNTTNKKTLRAIFGGFKK